MELRMPFSRRTSLIGAALAAALAVAPAVWTAAVAAPALAQDNHALPRRGDYLPPDVLQAGPRVDYAAAHLRKPPSGYGWYQLGRAYVMASVATGLIVEVVIL